MSRHLQEKETRVVLGAHRKVAARSMQPLVESVRHAPVMSVAPDASHDSSAKATLASKLNELLDENGLSQSAAAQLLGMPQPKVSAIRNYKLHGISLERLMQALLALNQQVEITVKPGLKSGRGSIRVAV
jgi:predicted XRE-type DNA-binding protein